MFHMSKLSLLREEINKAREMIEMELLYRTPEIIPKSGLDLEGYPDEVLIEGVEVLIKQMEDLRTEEDLQKLEDIRRKHFSLCRELNRRGSIAPAFRPRLIPVHPTCRAAIDNLFALDLQVLDIDWLWKNGKRDWECTKTAAYVCADTGEERIDLSRAWEFASQIWPMRKKTLALNIYEHEQYLLAMLRDDKVKSSHLKFQRDAERFRRKLISLTSKRVKGLRPTDWEDWPDIFYAGSIAGRISGRDPEEEWDRISGTLTSDIYYHLSGKRCARQTIEKRMKRLGKYRH